MTFTLETTAMYSRQPKGPGVASLVCLRDLQQGQSWHNAIPL